MVALTRLLFAAASVSAALIVARDGAKILSDLKTIDTDVKNLNAAVKNWDGTPTGGGAINTAESKLESDLKGAATDAANSSVLSTADCSTIVNYINTTLEPDIKAALNEIVSRKAAAKAAGFQSVVTQDLKNILSELDTLFSKLPSSCSSTTASKSSKSKIDSDFNSAISSFSS